MCARSPPTERKAWISHAAFTDEQVSGTLGFVKRRRWKSPASKTVTELLFRKPSITKRTPPASIKQASLLVCLHVYAESLRLLIPPILHSSNIHNNVKHAHLIYYLLIFHCNKTHSEFYLVWSRHHISIIFSLNINHGLAYVLHPVLLLKDSNGLLVGTSRPGPGVLTEEAEERMFCFKSAESSLFFRTLSFSLALTPLWLPLQVQWMLGGDPLSQIFT